MQSFNSEKTHCHLTQVISPQLEEGTIRKTKEADTNVNTESNFTGIPSTALILRSQYERGDGNQLFTPGLWALTYPLGKGQLTSLSVSLLFQATSFPHDMHGPLKQTNTSSSV